MLGQGRGGNRKDEGKGREETLEGSGASWLCRRKALRTGMGRPVTCRQQQSEGLGGSWGPA